MSKINNGGLDQYGAV